PAPRSYTREHMAEIHVPGASPIVQAVYAAALAAGARPAEPGEFTFRAFVHGRLDLGQAEAVERLISAVSRAERQQALRRLITPLAQRIAAWREELLQCAAQVEAMLDLEAEEIADASTAEVERSLTSLAASCRRLAAEAAAGEQRPEVARAALVGLANAGKSALANALLGRGAALVSAEAGTTRDLLAWQMAAAGMPMLLLDTVGYQPQTTALDAAAFRQAFARALAADVICLAIDGGKPLTDDLRIFLRLLRGRSAILVLCKADLPRCWQPEDARTWCQQEGVEVTAIAITSALTGEGIAQLRETIWRHADAAASGCLNQREASELQEAGNACDAALAALREGSIEIAAEEIRAAHAALGRLSGEGYAEEVLERIFARFCVGK
ncbi:MAG: 50S ribosome-binding GTPase, partial [Planctomycetota bacterium]|nr:50S ribosome-binding GTPase [Planctomycetota bacterium]